MLGKTALIGLAIISAIAAASLADVPSLDDIVNCFKLDQFTPEVTRDGWLTVSKEIPVGQTFITGPETITLSRIAISASPWTEQWTEEESLVLTVWDSPQKINKLGSFSMPHKWKLWEHGVIMFPLGISVTPNAEYYFELTVEGGDGIIPGINRASSDYSHGRLFVNGTPSEGDIWFETHVKKVWNKDADYQYYFDHWNLEYPGLEKVKSAVESKNWEKACKELVSYYEKRSDLIVMRKPRFNPNYDSKIADLAVNQQVVDQEGVIWHLGPDWNHYIQWPLRGGVGLTRTGLRKYLVGAYENTGDDKFAKAFNDMLMCNFRDQPSPIRAGAIPAGAKNIDASPAKGIGGGSMWSALGLGARMNQMWYFYSGVMASPSFTQDCRCAMIFNFVDMADVLSLMRGGGNWETQIADTLFEIGERHPELKMSKEWFSEGLSRLIASSRDSVYLDGVLQEASINYHGLVANRFLGLLEKGEKLQLQIPSSFRRRTEKMLDFILFATGPNWRIPATGDTFGPWSGSDILKRGAEIFNRKDMLWVATEGRQGHRPAADSRGFEYGGWYIMRSGWTQDSVYAIIHNGDNRGHGHHDSLQMPITAFGDEMVIDPGIYIYGTPESAELSKTTSHSTICVNDRNALQMAGPTTWITSAEYDYFDGMNAGYEGLEGVKARRRVLFIKPQYWIVVDSVLGNGKYKIDSRFVCAEGRASKQGSNAIYTNGKNCLLIASPKEKNTVIFIDEGRRAKNGRLRGVPVIRKCAQSQLPVNLVQVLIPVKGCDIPQVSVSGENLSDGSIKITVVFSKDKIDEAVFHRDGKLCFNGRDILKTNRD